MNEPHQPKNLILTVGLPRSGKSTWAKTQSAPIVSPDAIRLALHGHQYYPSAEPMIWAAAYLMVRSLFLAGNAAVIVDATNYHAKRRSKWESIAAEMGAAIKLQIFGTSKSVCIQRAYATNQPHLAEVIERMAEEWDIEGVDVNC